MKERKFVKLYHDVMSMKELNNVKLDLACRCVYSYLLSWQENNESVYPSINRIKEDLGFNSKSSINNYLNKLVDAGLLEITYRKNNTSVYKVKPLRGNYQVREDTVPEENTQPPEFEDYSRYNICYSEEDVTYNLNEYEG